MKVLIIGMDEARAESVATPLAAAGHEVVRARSHEEGKAMLNGATPHCVIFADENAEAGATAGRSGGPSGSAASQELASFIEKTAAGSTPPVRTAKPPARPDQKTVLVIEDREVHRRRIVTQLSAEGWYVIEAENGRLGALHIIDDDPDCILVGSVIGGKSSRGIIHSADRIRRAHPHPFAILVAADSAHPNQLAQLIEAGADDVIARSDGAGGLVRRLDAGYRLRTLLREKRALERQLAARETVPA